MSFTDYRERKKTHTLVLKSHLLESYVDVSFSLSFAFLIFNGVILRYM